ncbi:DUF4097 family beta strand repeat-containing protein [Paenibacillus nasutitermitis]|uniref:DUF4097 domain-containing protein n=1 Tax=Paenibacillus nasutitermitis TaxID=1652958 RepID=A0A916ZC91_9BACL|nr:DUF4097 family beta strand repeat-containing protein [Paenibacillus nasutitermitis]GGD86536.1 hypothetical protein GCM10010911_51260 [Paenibacillus nasutitermitis]
MRNWIIVAAILLVIGLIGMGSTMGKGMFDLGSVEIEQHETIDGTDAKKIALALDSANITVVKGTTNEIKASLTGKVSKKFIDKTHLKLIRDGDEVKVAVETNNGFTFGVSIFNVKLDLELPAQQYDSFVLDIGSGDTSLAGLSVQTVEIDAGSGNIQLEDLASSKVSVEVGSGDTKVSGLSADTAELGASSGNITIEKLTARKLSVDTGSGDVKMYDVEAELEVETASGNVRTEQRAINYPMEISTGSGDVTINTDEKPDNVLVTFSAGSGSLRNEWNVGSQSGDDDDKKIIFGDGGKRVIVDTGSGNLRLGER